MVCRCLCTTFCFACSQCQIQCQMMALRAKEGNTMHPTGDIYLLAPPVTNSTENNEEAGKKVEEAGKKGK
jgi:hypothetical protein